MKKIQSFAAKLGNSLNRDRSVYIIYMGIFIVTATIFQYVGLLSQANFTLYSASLFVLLIASMMILAMGYFFMLVAEKNPRPMEAFRDQLTRFFRSPEEFVAFLLMMTATSFMLSIFTSIKSFIPKFQHHIYDPLFAHIDRLIHFGLDPWVITHAVFISPYMSGFLNVIYNLWFFLYWTILFLFILRTEPVTIRLQFLTTNILYWIVIGGLLATLMASGGPVYYHHFVEGVDPFVQLMERLNSQNIWLEENTSFMKLWALPTQDIIWASFIADGTSMGEGISAMPSMHISIAVLMALAMGTINRFFGYFFWFFAILIQIGSVHLAWHYAIDGYLSAILTVLIWKMTGKFLAKRQAKAESV